MSHVCSSKFRVILIINVAVSHEGADVRTNIFGNNGSLKLGEMFVNTKQLFVNDYPHNECRVRSDVLLVRGCWTEVFIWMYV